MKEESWETAEREPDLPLISHKPWQAENPNFLLCQIDVCHCSSPCYLAKELWYTPFSTLLEFFTSLIIHSPLCSPAWFLRCTILHSHFLTANCTHIVCFSKFFFLNHIFFIIFLTMEPFQEPSFLSQMMMTTSGSSLPLSILPHTQHRLFHRKIGKMISQHY